MTEFVYTDSLEEIDSTAVADAFYNVHDKTLAIILHSNDDVWVYSGVPSWVWSQFRSASSVGSFYATTIKRNYGPGHTLGNFYEVDFREYSVPAPSMASMYSVPTFPLAAAPRTVGTPKGLTYADDAKVTTKAEAFPLSSEPKHLAASNSTTVVFEVGGNEKTANFDNIGNVEDAVREINRLADMLGLDSLVVKAVTVHFE